MGAIGDMKRDTACPWPRSRGLHPKHGEWTSLAPPFKRVGVCFTDSEETVWGVPLSQAAAAMHQPFDEPEREGVDRVPGWAFWEWRMREPYRATMAGCFNTLVRHGATLSRSDCVDRVDWRQA